jgi:hypothetical protein
VKATTSEIPLAVNFLTDFTSWLATIFEAAMALDLYSAPGRYRTFSHQLSGQTRPALYPTYCIIDTGGVFYGNKQAGT